MRETPRNASAAMATVLFDELLRCGVRDVVLCPGSRSAALAFAARDAVAGLEPADGTDEGDPRSHGLHTRIDERSAAFLALGIARTCKRPVALVTTSGTAVANLHPAVLEAAHSGVPLVVLTADRPARLRGTNANQTTDQVKVFGSATRLFADVPAGRPGHDEARQAAGWRALAARAVWTAAGRLGDRPGPVHLNLQFEEPLVPGAGDGWAGSGAARPLGAPWMQPGETDHAEPESLEPDRRTVVVAGDDAGPPARMLAETAGWPLLAEPTSGSRTGDSVIRGYRLLLSDPELADRIERVVVYGHPTLSRPVSRLLARDDVEIVAVTGRSGWTDSGHHVSKVVRGVRVDESEPDDSTRAWLDLWKNRDAEVSQKLDELLDGWGELTPHHVAGAVSAALPPGGLLFVGASNPVRDLDLMVARYTVGKRRMVVGNRGLAGIDGSVSSAIGASLGRPYSTRSFALLGDVTFLHDANGLIIGPHERRPDLTIVVVNDDGGSIFASLEQGGPSYSDTFDKLFGTPHGVDVASLCAATRTPHWRVDSLEELRHALASPAGGIEVVEAVVRRDNRRALDAAIRGLAGQQERSSEG
jgi:2-succinyl-5-enolpyruvyl-6-hydroxy-3-cyclohexene-1-carboxylate synthase